MRLSLILPPVQPEVYPDVTGCPYTECGGQHLQHWQAVPKPLRDTQLHAVIAQRYRCVRCGRTFRVYPLGVSHDQTSARLHAPTVTSVDGSETLALQALCHGAVTWQRLEDLKRAGASGLLVLPVERMLA